MAQRQPATTSPSTIRRTRPWSGRPPLCSRMCCRSCGPVTGSRRRCSKRCPSRLATSHRARCSARCSTSCGTLWPERSSSPWLAASAPPRTSGWRLTRRCTRCSARISSARCTPPGRPLFFAHPAITEHRTPVLWRYLRAEIGVGDVTPADVAARQARPSSRPSRTAGSCASTPSSTGFPRCGRRPRARTKLPARPGPSRSSGSRTAVTLRPSTPAATRPSTSPGRSRAACPPSGVRWRRRPPPGGSWTH